MEAVQSPVIPLIGTWTRNNPGTVSFGQGIAFYGPPPQAFRRVRQCLADPAINRYGPAEGMPELRQALKHKLYAQNSIDIHDENAIVVTAGSNMAFNTAILAITDPGDEVILPLPYYFNHEMSLTMERCKPIPVSTDENFHLRIKKIENAISDKTKAIVTISPNNPSGAVYTKEELVAVNNLCQQYCIYHISDEAYEDFCYDHHSHYSVATDQNNCKHTISLFSFSKGYGFAGWRIGYMVIPQHLLSAINKIQDTILISPPMVSQHAALGALEAGAEFIELKRQAMSSKRSIVLEMLADIACLKSVPTSEGAFYVMLDIDSSMKDLQLVKRLITEFGVATLPGSAFGIHQDCHIRLSYGALSDDDIETGMRRLKKGLNATLN